MRPSEEGIVIFAKKTRVAAGAALTTAVIWGAAILAVRTWGQGMTPRPGLVVLSKSGSELAIVDPEKLQTVKKVGTGPVPHEVAVSANGKLAVATNYGPHQNGTTLSVIDLDTMTVVQLVELGAINGPHGIAFWGGKFYFTAEGSQGFAGCATSCATVSSYDPATKRVDWTIPTGQQRTHMILFAPGKREFYLANIESGTISAVDVSGGDAKSTFIHVGKGPEGMDVSPDGKELWAANSGDGTVSVIDTATKKVVATIDVKTKHSNRLKFTPDGRLVLISDLGAGELVIVDAAAQKEVKRLALGKNCEGILVQPDGARAFVAVSADDKIAVVDLKKLEVTTTFAAGKEPDGMAWRSR
jgi:YVTN family beta-propeller protein